MGCEKQVIHKLTAVGASTVKLMARVTKLDATNVVQSDVDEVRVDVHEVTPDDRTPVDADGEEITDGTAYAEPTVSSVVFNTLQTDDTWGEDDVGYNVAYKFTPPDRAKLYDVRVKLTLISGDTLVLPYEVTSV